MKYKWKRVLAVVFLFIIVAGWYVTVCGIGTVKPIQDRMKLGLDIKGGVYVVMEAKDGTSKARNCRRLWSRRRLS